MATLRLRKHFGTLKHMAKCSAEDCKHLVNSGSDDLIMTLSEICQNLLTGNIPLSEAQLESL